MERDRIHQEDWELEERAPSLPSRRELNQKKRRSTGNRRKKKRTNIEFPLVKIMLFLFFTIVTAMFTYPIWNSSLQ